MVTSSEHLNAIAGTYDDAAFPFLDENILMLDQYSERLLRTVRDHKLRTLLSLGIGYETVTEKLVGAVLRQDLLQYTVVEGSNAIIAGFRPKVPAGLPIDIRDCLFEEFAPDQRFDAIEMGFVLEHVDDPRRIVQRYRGFLNPGGVLFVAVPNARSLHRLIGHAAGLLADIYALSDADRRLGHQRYFDNDRLTGLLNECGFRIARREGMLLKPLTTSQLRSLQLPVPVWRALCTVATDLPDIANAIYVEAVA